MRAALLAALLAGAPEPAAAAGWAYALCGELMSPYCPGRTLADCPSLEAESLRLWVAVQEAAGRSRAEVEAELLARYGESILAAPRPRGFGLTAYAVPVLAFLAGGGLLGGFLWRQTRPGRAPLAASPGAPLDPELERALEDEMAREPGAPSP